MEILNTISTNARTLANANIDWSLDGGMIWLTAMVVVFSLVIGWAAWEGN
jgi:hypothetical protein